MDELPTYDPTKNVMQAILILKKGTYLLKYGRRGKPKFCPFWLSEDETSIIWYADRKEKHLKLSLVSRILPGQHTVSLNKLLPFSLFNIGVKKDVMGWSRCRAGFHIPGRAVAWLIKFKPYTNSKFEFELVHELCNSQLICTL